MELVAFLIAIVFISVVFSSPARRYEKRNGKKLGRGAAGAALHTLNELFHPSQANASQVIEEQREARVAKPGAGDKDLDTLISEQISNAKKPESNLSE